MQVCWSARKEGQIHNATVQDGYELYSLSMSIARRDEWDETNSGLELVLKTAIRQNVSSQQAA